MPTAQTSFAEPTATLRSELTARKVASRLGLRTTLHELPSQCSTSVSGAPDAPVLVPTAQTSVAETAATPVNRRVRDEAAAGTRLQLAPFQCSISGLEPAGGD